MSRHGVCPPPDFYGICSRTFVYWKREGIKGKEASMKISLSKSILRLGILLVLIGFFAPIGCDANGHQIAQGILGYEHQAGNARFLSSIENSYGYVLFGVFAFALLGLLLTFLGEANHGFLLGFVCLAVSLALLMIVLLRLKTFRYTGLLNFALTIFPFKMKLLIGGYSMVTGYLVGIIGFVLRTLRITKS
jgi:hypothetical protein